jgi:hypothetical protein
MNILMGAMMIMKISCSNGDLLWDPIPASSQSWIYLESVPRIQFCVYYEVIWMNGRYKNKLLLLNINMKQSVMLGVGLSQLIGMLMWCFIFRTELLTLLNVLKIWKNKKAWKCWIKIIIINSYVNSDESEIIILEFVYSHAFCPKN